MIHPKRSSDISPPLRTGSRIALACAVFGALVFAASNCDNATNNGSAGNANINANTNQPATANRSASATVTVGREPSVPERAAVPGANTGTSAATAALPDGVAEHAVKMLDGKSFRLVDYAGKVVVLDIWATWCGPCRKMVPDLVAVTNEYKGRGVEVIGLTTEDPETAHELVRNFAREFKINYKLGWIEEDMYMSLSRGQNVIPQTFVIGPDGRIIKHIRGYGEQVPAMLREAIEQGVSKRG